MGYCTNCGHELSESAAFCSSCGAPAETKVPASVFAAELEKEEQAFLETTHRLLRWERKAWSIASKVFIISGIVFSAIFMLFVLIGIIAAIDGEYFGGMLVGIGFVYTVIFGGMFIGIGIVNKKAGEKLPQYIDTVHTDFSIAYKRCDNVGMLVFTILFGVVSPIFFIINFARMKSSRATIERIMMNQNVRV